MLWGNLYAGLGFISHLLNILPAVLSNLAVSLMHVRLSTSVLPQMPPLPSVKSDVFSQTACRCYPTFPKAPDMSASFSQLSSPLCTLFFFFFFLLLPLRFPLLFFLWDRSHLSSLSLGLFPPLFSLSVFLPASFLIERLGSALQGFILPPFLRHLFSTSAFGVSACFSMPIRTPSPPSLPLCVHLHLPVFSLVKIDAPTHPGFRTESAYCWIFQSVVGDVFCGGD